MEHLLWSFREKY